MLACNFLLALDQPGTGVSTTSLLWGFHSPVNILGARELMGVNDSEQENKNYTKNSKAL